jgi:hypothetical protein
MLVPGSENAHKKIQAYLHRNPELILPSLTDYVGKCDLVAPPIMEYSLFGGNGMQLCCTDLVYPIRIEGDVYQVPAEIKSVSWRSRAEARAGKQLRTFYRAVRQGLDPNIEANEIVCGLIINGSPERFRITPYNLRGKPRRFRRATPRSSRRNNAKYDNPQLVT